LLPTNQQRGPEGTPIYAFTEGVYEIHGNVLYMRCSDESGECPKAPLFYKGPLTKTNQIVPLCKHCSRPMKPHCMFFDESYSEQWYKKDTVCEYLENKMDALIVVGTAL
jgi:NAD-dependent SIR2 family protein deacetylase